MNVRLKCSCGARFMTGDDLRGQLVRCPKCRQAMRVPQLAPSNVPDADSNVVFQTEDEVESLLPEHEPPSRWEPRESSSGAGADHQSRAWRWALLLLVLLGPIAIVGTLVALPYFTPKDPREIVARQYLEALSRADLAEAGRLSVIMNEHPRNVTRVERVSSGANPPPLVGKFTGLRQFHSEISAKYTYNENRQRFEPNDPLGAGLEALSNLESKLQEQVAVSGDSAKKKYSNPEDKLLDEVINRYGAISEIAKGTGGLLSSGTLGPTYEDLLKNTKTPLQDAERKLAEHYARDPIKWKRLLGDRWFLDLPDLGNFELYDVEIVSTIRTEGQSFGEPGRPIKLRLVRFVMGSIDTGWRVWQAE